MNTLVESKTLLYVVETTTFCGIFVHLVQNTLDLLLMWHGVGGNPAAGKAKCLSPALYGGGAEIFENLVNGEMKDFMKDLLHNDLIFCCQALGYE